MKSDKIFSAPEKKKNHQKKVFSKKIFFKWTGTFLENLSFIRQWKDLSILFRNTYIVKSNWSSRDCKVLNVEVLHNQPTVLFNLEKWKDWRADSWRYTFVLLLFASGTEDWETVLLVKPFVKNHKRSSYILDS